MHDIKEVFETNNQGKANDLLARGWRLLTVSAVTGIIKEGDVADLITNSIYILGLPHGE